MYAGERLRAAAEAAILHKDLAERLNSLEERPNPWPIQHDTFSRNTRNQPRQVFDALRELNILRSVQLSLPSMSAGGVLNSDGSRRRSRV